MLAVRPAVAAFAVVLATTPAFAAPAPAGAGKVTEFPFPAKAHIVVHVNGVERARDRLAAMLTAALPADAPGLNKQIDAGVKELLKDRNLSAVPKDGRAFVVIHDLAGLAEESKPVSVLVPVTDAKAFRESFLTPAERKSYEKGANGVDSFKSEAGEATIYVTDLKGYLAVGPDKASVERYTEKYEKATPATLGADTAEAFAAADVSVYVNMDVINDQYGMQIRTFKQLMEFGLQQAQMGGMAPGLNKQQIEAFKTVAKALFQGVEDCHAIVAGAEFRPAGLNFRLAAQFADDTETAKSLKGETPTDLAGLAKLPRGQMVYTASKLGRKLAEAMRSMSGEFAAGEDDEKTAETLAKLAADLADAGPGADLDAASLPAGGLKVTAYADPARAVAALTKTFQALPAGAAVTNVRLKDRPKVTADAVTHRGFKLTEVRLAFDFEATVKDIPEQMKEMTLASMKRMVQEKTALWLGTDGKQVVVVRAADAKAAQKLLDEYLDGKQTVGADAAFQATRKNLPAEATTVSLTDAGKFLEMMSDYLKTMGDTLPGLPVQLPKLKPVKGETAYLGVALTLKPQSGQVDFFLPGAAVGIGRKALGSLFTPVD